MSGTGPTKSPPESIQGVSGDLIVALSDGDFISFAMRWPSLGKALVAIKSDRFWPLSLPNVARKVIAQSPTERYFPLTAEEKLLLLRLYPADWRAR